MSTNVLTITDSSDEILYKKSKASSDYIYEISIDELNNIFKEDPASIYRYDTSKCLAFITYNGKEISLHESDNHQTSDVLFMKIKSADLFGNDVIIAVKNNCLISENPMKWIRDEAKSRNSVSEKMPTPDLSKTSDAYEYCRILINHYNGIDKLPAMEYCFNYRFNCGKMQYQGYVPSTYQLNTITKYHLLIGYLLSNFIQPPNLCRPFAMSSLSAINDHLIMQTSSGDLINNLMSSMFMKFPVLPVFKEIPNLN